MNRGGIEGRTRELAASPANPEKDWRPLALLILGLGLLAAQLAGHGHAPWTGSGQGRGANPSPGLIWLAGSEISEGLYQVPAQLLPPLADSPGGLYRRLGLGVAPDDHWVSKGKPASLLLVSHESPRIIPDPARLASLFFRPIPVSRADAELLSTINGIGPQLAARIVARRNEKGDFLQPVDLLAVPGIGQAKLTRLQPYLFFEQR